MFGSGENQPDIRARDIGVTALSSVMVFGLVYSSFKFNPVNTYERVSETRYYIRVLYSIGWSFWNELIAFGVPEPLQKNYIFRPLFHLSFLFTGRVDIPLISAFKRQLVIRSCFFLVVNWGLACGSPAS